MFKAKIFASHNCWASRISKKFPEEKMALNNTIWLEDKHALDILSVRANSDKNFDNIIKYLKHEKTIHKVEVMERTLQYMIIQVDTYSPQPLIRHIYNNMCFQLEPILLENGGESWILGASSKANLKRVFEIIKSAGYAQLKFIVPTSFDDVNMTNKQRAAFNLAKLMGYYEIPRKITVTKLAKASRISKTAYLEHLRKAEIKIFNKFALSQK